MRTDSQVDAARSACDELSRIADDSALPYLAALASSARGAVALAGGDPLAALESLQAACARWQEMDAPFEHAQTRVTIGLAYRQLGDVDGAELEFDAAHEVFDRLGAAPAAARLAPLVRPPVSAASSTGLTGREIEVLRLVADGLNNQAIGERLFVSDHTVHRHLANILNKLSVSSRAAAVAQAARRGLLA